MRLLKTLKKIPIDFGQESVAATTFGKRIAKSLVPRVAQKEARAALDVGCREGIQSRWLESLGYHVTSIDLEARYSRCLVVDVDRGLPLAEGSFDLIWCSEVIEHLADPEAAVREFLRVLRPGGEIVLTTPNSGFWFFKLCALFGFPPQRMQRADHRHFFRMPDVESLFPGGRVYGFFPYFLIKGTLKSHRAIGWLSPTFVVHLKKFEGR